MTVLLLFWLYATGKVLDIYLFSNIFSYNEFTKFFFNQLSKKMFYYISNKSISADWNLLL